MKLSCNGCRILRKGCSKNCVIRPCLEWINSPESQSNATLFLAKFYGRTALLNLINAAPQHLAPGVFKSLLYEACGRLVNPTYGSLGLFWSGEWEICESAVNAVLSGSKINNGVGPSNWHNSSTSDIRHMSKGTNVYAMRGKPKPNCQSETTEPMEPSFLSLNHFNRDSLDLELTLSYRT